MQRTTVLGFGLSFFVTLFSVLNPVHAVPLYLAMVQAPTAETTRRVALLAATTVFLALMLALLIGEDMLHFFGITVPAFQVGGGVLILLMGLSMLQGEVSRAKTTPAEAAEAAQWREIAIVPIGTPILAGAGSLSTVIVFDHQAMAWHLWGTLVVGIVANALLCWAFLRYSDALLRLLGRTGVNVVSRLMGMILVAMAVQFMADGIHGLFPTLRGPGAT
ncbi:MAG: MarC family protein [Candidatus Binatia bacterium]